MSEEAGPSVPHPVVDETQNEENRYRASLVWPLKTKISDVTEWLYAILLSLDHNAVLTVSV